MVPYGDLVADSTPRTTVVMQSNGIEMAVDHRGTGDPVLLVHGFPHTHALWSKVGPRLAAEHGRRVIAPDLRGCGGSTRAEHGYDAVNLAADLAGVLDAGDVQSADVVAIDAGVPAAVALALLHPTRVRRLAVMESTLGQLPGAEDFFQAGPPWWFGFHQTPALAEHVLVGHEGEYLDFFIRSGTHDGRGVDPSVRDAFVSAYSGTESLRCGFEYYRAMPTTARQLVTLTAQNRLTMPTLAIGAAPVGDALGRQLISFCDDLRTAQIPDCGHLVPLDRPDALLDQLLDFWQ